MNSLHELEKRAMNNKELVNSILNVEGNIRAYKEMKKKGKYIPRMISLDVMEKRRAELWAEYNKRHKGELRGNGTII